MLTIQFITLFVYPGLSGCNEQAIDELQRLQRSNKQISQAISRAISYFQTQAGHSSIETYGTKNIINVHNGYSESAVLSAAFHLFVSKDADETMRILDECAAYSISLSNECFSGGFYVDALRVIAMGKSAKKEVIQSITLLSERSLSCLVILAK